MTPRLAAISVDLDEISCYREIFGLPQPIGNTDNPIYQRAVPRFERLFKELGIQATFFAVGKELQNEDNANLIKRLSEQEHEIANHTQNHCYDLTLKDLKSIFWEIEEGVKTIEKCTGRKPIGFRAPGYTINQKIVDVLSELGVLYDSSIFPCPVYYVAKVAAMCAIRLSGRQSRSVVSRPEMLMSSSDPYRLGHPYWRAGDGLIEFPIGVTKGFSGRLPYYGTSLVLSGVTGSKILSQLMLGKPLINLELHGIDLADSQLDDIEGLQKHQPDLRLSCNEKEMTLRSVINLIGNADYKFVTLNQAAEVFADIL